MLLHVLGHVHLTRHPEGPVVPVSPKALALLTYLCLEGVAHHRERLAELLWDTPDPLHNLRVELARLRQGGVAHFPDRQPMLSFQVPLELHAWQAAAGHTDGERLLPWLATLRGLPLSGLEDLGGGRFRDWLEGQRWSLGEQVERTLGAVYGRCLDARQRDAAARLLARAEQLNLRMPDPGPGAAAGGAAPAWYSVREEQGVLQDVLDTARRSTEPQLVLLCGRVGSGKRTLLRQVVGQSGGGWTLLQVQASGQPALVQAALAGQLAHLLERIGVPPPPAPAAGNTGDGDGLLHLAALLGAAGRPVVLALHHAALAQAWWPDLARFLLDLPLPLVLVLTETVAAQMDAVRAAAPFLDPGRTHRLDLTPLSPRQVLQAWQRAGLHGEEHSPARAAQLVQRSGGWPLYAQALYIHAAGSGLERPTLPEPVRGVLLAQLGRLPAELRPGLARLSLVHAPIGPEAAALLLGEAAPQVLAQGAAHGLLVPAAPVERVRLPGLTHRSRDQVSTLQFCDEATRVTLAASLSGGERQELRALLARHFLPTAPVLGRHYLRAAGLQDGGPPDPPSAAHLPGCNARPVPAPPPGPTGRRELWTPGGYRLALDGGTLEVTRAGGYAAPPQLCLELCCAALGNEDDEGPVPAGPWQLTARLDVFRGGPPSVAGHTAYALGLRAGSGPGQAYLPARNAAPDDTGGPHMFGGLPLGTWFTLHGQGPAGPLQLSVRALDVALTVAALRWGGQDVLPGRLR